MTRSAALCVGFLASMTLGSLSGCHNTYPNYYGGYPAYPQTYSPNGVPIQTLTPGGSYVPGNAYPSTIPQGSYPQGIYPQGTIPQQYSPGTNPTYQNPSGGLTPVPDNNLPGGSGGGSAPLYNNSPTPNNYSTPNPYEGGGLNSTQFQPPIQGSGLNSIQPASMNQPAPVAPFNQEPIRELRSEPTRTAASGPFATSPELGSDAEFMAPVTRAPAAAAPSDFPGDDPFSSMPAEFPGNASQAKPLPQEEFQVHKFARKTADEPEVFANHPEHKWLRGVVSKEAGQNFWGIVYNDNPSQNDPWGGHLALAPSPHLEQLQEGDLVEVQGQIDTLDRDPAGKPVYVVSGIKKLAQVP